MIRLLVNVPIGHIILLNVFDETRSIINSSGRTAVGIHQA